MLDMSDFCRIFRIMSNSDNTENRIRIHADIHIKNEYEYGYPYYRFCGYEYG
jgi:hypothetical protein